jgi:hypothetical protein
LLEQLADAGQVAGSAKVTVASVAGDLPALVVEHPRAEPAVVRAAELDDARLPVTLLAEEFVDFVVEVADLELAEAGWATS